MHIPHQQVVIKLLSEQVQHRLARERILLAVTQMTTKEQADESRVSPPKKWNLGRSSLSASSVRLLSIMLSTGSLKTTFLDHKLRKSTRQWVTCLSSWAIFELVTHQACLTCYSFSWPFHLLPLTSRSHQHTIITLYTQTSRWKRPLLSAEMTDLTTWDILSSGVLKAL